MTSASTCGSPLPLRVVVHSRALSTELGRALLGTLPRPEARGMDTGSNKGVPARRRGGSAAGGRTVVRLRGPDDVLGVLPWRLGFHPRESLVVVVLEGSRLRDRLVMRLDLPLAEDEAAVARDTARRAAQAGADAVLAVVYTAAPDVGGELPRCDLVDDLAGALDDHEVELCEAMLVRGGRRWSYLCRDLGCCPTEGVPLPDRPTAAADAYAAEAVGQGATVLPDRESLRGRVEPSDHAVARAVRVQAAGELDEMVDRAQASGGGGMRTVAAARLALLRERYADGDREPPSGLDALLVAVLLHDTRVRDGLMTAALDDDADTLLELLGQVARLVDDDVAAPVCTVLAWLAYAAGDGALALVAVERALRADPGATMARLLLDGIDRMVRPAELREVSRAVRAELDGGGPGVGDGDAAACWP